MEGEEEEEGGYTNLCLHLERLTWVTPQNSPLMRYSGQKCHLMLKEKGKKAKNLIKMKGKSGI